MNNLVSSTHKKMLWSVAELEESTGISQRTLWANTHPRGALKCVRVGRRVLYRPEDARVWLEFLQQQQSNSAT